jgi:hypothetical protein
MARSHSVRISKLPMYGLKEMVLLGGYNEFQSVSSYKGGLRKGRPESARSASIIGLDWMQRRLYISQIWQEQRRALKELTNQ